MNESDCDCTTGVSQQSLSTGLIDSIINLDLYLVRKEIVPANVSAIGLDNSYKYYFTYPPGQVKLRLGSDSTFSYDRVTGTWGVDSYGLSFRVGNVCPCDTGFFLGNSSLSKISPSNIVKLEHSYRNKKITKGLTAGSFF